MVKVLMVPTVRNRRLIDIYKDLEKVELHYDAREKDNVILILILNLGLIFVQKVDVTPATGSMTQSRSISHKGKEQETKKKNFDISVFQSNSTNHETCCKCRY